MIDLRSDTLTRPTAGMLAAMASAPVGDDVYDEDPSVRALEARVATLLGHEAGLFCATGSLSNQLGVWSLVRPGQELVCDSSAHVVRAELGAHASNHGVTTRTWVAPRGVATVALIEPLLEVGTNPYLVSTAAVALENTHNLAGGSIQPLQNLREIAALVHGAGAKLHLDGARLWNAHVATGVPLTEYGGLFDTISVCFSKGLGAPIGSMLVSDVATIARARVQRKRLGAGWRQAGLLAAAADYALTHQLVRLADDHTSAKVFAQGVAAFVPRAVDGEPETNIVAVSTGTRPAGEVVEAASARGVAVSALGRFMVRAVTHQDVSLDECRRAGEIVGDILSA
jgi:threonine aldolase